MAIAPEGKKQSCINGVASIAVEGGRASLHACAALGQEVVERRLRCEFVCEDALNGRSIPTRDAAPRDRNAKPQGPLEHVHENEIDTRIAQRAQLDVVRERDIGLAAPQTEPVVVDSGKSRFES